MQRKNISLNKYLSGGTYYWYVQTIDTGLAKSNWSAGQSIVVGADVTAPNISGVSSAVTSSTATITWTTDENSNSSVHYGITNATTSFSGISGLRTIHSVTLSILTASTFYYYNVSSCDYWGNCNTSIQYNFTTSAVVVPPVNPPSGGGGGGGGIPKKTNQTLPEFDVDFSEVSSGSLQVKQGDVKTFSFNGETTHKISATEITVTSAKLIIESEPITAVLTINETKQIDINSDGENDFEIKLDSITLGKAKLLLSKLSGADIVAREETEETAKKEALFDVKINIENFLKVVKSGRDVIAQIEVLNVNNIGQVDVLVEYAVMDKENNTIAEGSDTLAVEAVASFVRSLTIHYNTPSGIYNFKVKISYQDIVMASGSSEFRVIRNYEIIIAVGITAIIIIGIFFYLWTIKRKEEKDIGMLKRQINKLKNKKRKKKYGRSKNR
ncbi:MAG: fibronectin type III domain-containing protein [Candidatus Nanoarchaeia archaeon]|nr:fibronectin type III domain-containing protein [Candidatus Nanoarchaeia archaeon]MDD5589356.1 fibronectin type III domain-containing protein [Candidatus Nanoarchaeia archaeon]